MSTQAFVMLNRLICDFQGFVHLRCEKEDIKGHCVTIKHVSIHMTNLIDPRNDARDKQYEDKYNVSPGVIM